MRKRTPPSPRTVARSQSALRIEVLHRGEGPSPARGDKVQSELFGYGVMIASAAAAATAAAPPGPVVHWRRRWRRVGVLAPSIEARHGLVCVGARI